MTSRLRQGRARGCKVQASGKEVVASLAEKAESLGYRLMPCGLFPGNWPGQVNFIKAVVTKSYQDVYRILGVAYMDPTKRNSTISQEVGVDYRGQLVAHDQLCKWGHQAQEEGDSEDVPDYDSE
ncbi:hypothetical protein JCM11641_006760 [Rhodosporidiobolus odoratus]